MRSVVVFAGTSSSDSAVRESLLVDELAENLFKLMASPGLVLGLAKGDVFKIEEGTKPVLVQRGGNLAIQVYKKSVVASRHAHFEELILESLTTASLDGITDQQLVFTIPISEGFSQIENVFNSAVSQCPEYEWYYGNVYDPVDGVTPLNWWKTSE